MTNLEVDLLSKKPKVQASGTPNTGKSEAKSEAVPVGKSASSDNQTCNNLGITQEEYLKLCSENPAFAQMSVEEQIKYIAEKKNSSPQPAAQTTDVNTQNNTEAANQASQDNVDPAATPAESTAPAPVEEAETKDVNGFDKAAFSKMDTTEKYEACVAELAKNKYMYGDSSAKKTAEDWNNLSDEERQKLISEAESTFQKSYIKYTDSENTVKAFFDTVMTETQAANNYGMSLEELRNQPEARRTEIVYDYLFDLDSRNLMSPVDKVRYDETKLLCETASELYKKETGEDLHLCPGEAVEYINKSNQKSISEAEYNHIKNKINNGEEVSDYQMKKFQSIESLMNKVGPDGLTYFGTKQDTAKLRTEILSSEKYGAAFEKADNSKKAEIVLNYLNENYRNLSKEDYINKINEFRDDAIECGDSDLALGLQALATSDEQLAMLYANDDSDGSIVLNSGTINELGPKAAKVAAQKAEECKDQKLGELAGNNITKNAEGDVAVEVSSVTSKSKYESVQNSTVDLSHRVEEPEQQIAITENIAKNSILKVRRRATKELGKLHENAQIPGLNVLTKNAEPEILEDAASVPSTLADKNQTEGAQIVFDATLHLDKDNRIKTQKLLADNIIECKQENQLAMHKMMMTSNDDEVLAHTSSNINKYHESVQAEAIKASYATGNQKAIDAVNSQLDACSQQAVAEAAKEYNISQSRAETEARNTKDASKIYAESVINNNKINDNLTEPAELNSLSESDKKKYYMDLFLNTTDSKRYSLLSKLPENQLKEIIGKLCQYNSSMIKGLVSQGLGKYVLQATGKSIDVLYSTVNIMFKKGGKDSKFAADYVLSNKATIHFPDDMIEKASEILGKDNIKVQGAKDVISKKTKNSNQINDENTQYVSNPYGFVKNSLQPRLSDLYPNKKEMFYNA